MAGEISSAMGVAFGTGSASIMTADSLTTLALGGGVSITGSARRGLTSTALRAGVSSITAAFWGIIFN